MEDPEEKNINCKELVQHELVWPNYEIGPINRKPIQNPQLKEGVIPDDIDKEKSDTNLEFKADTSEEEGQILCYLTRNRRKPDYFWNGSM